MSEVRMIPGLHLVQESNLLYRCRLIRELDLSHEIWNGDRHNDREDRANDRQLGEHRKPFSGLHAQKDDLSPFYVRIGAH